MKNTFSRAMLSATNEAGRKVLPTPNGPDHNRSYTGGPKMAAESQYSDSAHARNPEPSKNIVMNGGAA